MNKLKKVYFVLFALLISTGVWAQESITYLDYSGLSFSEETHNAMKMTDVSTSLSDRYYVEGDVTISGTVTLIYHTLLILCDGATLTINATGTDEKGIDLNGRDLTIYAQSSGSHRGKLVINSSGNGIDGNGEVTIKGGDISVTSTSGKGISCQNFTLNGGIVTAVTGNDDAIYVDDGHFHITGGKVSATSDQWGIYATKNVRLNGGQVYTKVKTDGGIGGIHSDDYIYLGWTNAEDYIEANSYIANSSIQAYRNFYIDGSTPLYADPSISASSINGKKLTPKPTNPSYAISVSTGITGGTIAVDKDEAFYNERVAITVTPDAGNILASLSYTYGGNTYTIGTGYYDIKQQANDYVIMMPTANVTINATFAPPVAQIGSVQYTSLAAALAAVSDGETITILSDKDESGTDYDFDIHGSNRNVTIDMNGCTVSFGDITNKDNDLTITDNSTNHNGVFNFGTFGNQGNITIKDVTVNCDWIDNAGGTNHTLTFDNAKVVCSGAGIQWMSSAGNVVLTNGADVEIHGSFFLAYDADNNFSITGDATVLKLVGCTFSGYADISDKIRPYVKPALQSTFAYGVEYGTASEPFILRYSWSLQLISNLGADATVTFYAGGASEPTAFDVSNPGTSITEANAGEWVVAHIVPSDYYPGYWTDTQLLMAMEPGASLAPKRALGLELGRPLTLLKRDTYDDEGVEKTCYNGAGWYYYRIPETHTTAAGYISTILDGFVPPKLYLNDIVSMSGNVLTVADVGWKAEITFAPETMDFVFDGNEHKPVVTKIEVKKDNELGATLTADFDKQFTIDGDKRIGTRSIVIHATESSWFAKTLNTGTIDDICDDASFEIRMPLTVADNTAQKGTETNPWLVRDVAEMNLFAKVVSIGYYSFEDEYVSLTDNLNYDDDTSLGFMPVGLRNGIFDGNGGWSFYGTFEGNNHTISNLKYKHTIPTPLGTKIGLFGCVRNGTIKNLNLNGCTFDGNEEDASSCGVVAGEIRQTTISNVTTTSCHLYATKKGWTEIGGIVGNMEGGSRVTNCTVTGTTDNPAIIINKVTDADGNIQILTGGIAGFCHESEIDHCIVENCVITSDFPNSYDEYNPTELMNEGNCVGGILGDSYSPNMHDNMVKGSTSISDVLYCNKISVVGAIIGGYDGDDGGDSSLPIIYNNYYDKSVTVSFKNSEGTTLLSGYTPRGTRLPGVGVGDLTELVDDTDPENPVTYYNGAKMHVFPVNLSVTVSGSYGQTVEIDPDPSTSAIETWTAGTNCYSIDGNGHPSIAVGDDVNLVFEPTIYRVDDGRTYHAELSMKLNDVVFDATSFTMPDKAVNLDAVYTEANWFTVATNGKKWMTFYQEWNENTDPTVSPVQANYLVTDPANAATTPTFELLTISRLDGTRFETQNLEGISYNSVPTLLRGRDADGKDANLPAILRFDYIKDLSSLNLNLREPAWVEEFKGVNVETEFDHGIYVMNGNGDFIYAEPDPTDNKLKAHRCYIDLNGNPTNGAPLRWSEDTNSIKNVELTVDSDSWYTISGMKLNGKPMKQGVYINGRKKVTIK